MKWSAIVCLLAVPWLTGCGVPQMFRIENPTTRVGSVSVTETSGQGTQVTAFVEVRNPNKSPLPLLLVRYTLTVDDQVVTYEDELHRTLPSDGLQIVELPVAFPTGGAGLAGRAFDLRGAITYKPPGQFRKLLTESRVPLPTVSFAGSGQID